MQSNGATGRAARRRFSPSRWCLFVVLSGGDDRLGRRAPETDHDRAGERRQHSPPASPSPTPFEIQLRDGAARRRRRRARGAPGATRCGIAVRSDEDAGEVHVHGYEIEDSRRGRRRRPGRVHGRHRRQVRDRGPLARDGDIPLAELTVQPGIGDERRSLRIARPALALARCRSRMARSRGRPAPTRSSGSQDLPIPAWLFAWAASLVLIVSFALLSVAWRAPRLQEEGWRPLPRWLSPAAGQPGHRGRSRALARGLPARRSSSTRACEGTEAPDRNFAARLRLRHLLARAGAPERPLRRRLPGLQPLAGDRARRRRRLPPGRRAVGARAARLPRAARPLAGRGRASSPSSGSSWSTAPAGAASGCSPRRRGGDPRLQRRSPSSAWRCSASSLDRARRGVLGLLPDVLDALAARGPRRAPRPPQAAVRRPCAGETSPGSLAMVLVSIGATSYDGAQEGALTSPIERPSTGSATSGSASTAAFRVNGTLWLAIVIAAVALLFVLGVRGMHTVTGSPPVRELRRAFAAHADPDRARLPGRPLLQPLPLPGAGPVHLPALRSARRRAPTSSGPPQAASTTG